MLFAIRDDDTSYFTKPAELEKAYSNFDIPITLSIIPNAVYKHGATFPYGNEPFDREQALVGENEDLVSFIKGKMAVSEFEVIMHGITHKYYHSEHGWIPEMKCFSFDKSFDELKKMKKYLETLFDTEITSFAAPSNELNSDAYRAIDILGMNTMCYLSKKIDHPLSLRYLRYWTQRNFDKLFRSEKPMMMKYKNHVELPLWQVQEPSVMWKNYCHCKTNGEIPFIIYTHYWHLNRNEQDKNHLNNIVEMMINDGAEPVFVSQCFI